MKTNQCAIIAGSVIVGALLLKRFTTVLGAESFNAELPPVPYISQQAQQAAQHHFSPPAGPPSTPPNVPCDLSVVNTRVSNVVDGRKRELSDEKTRENTLKNTLKTFNMRKAKSKKDYDDNLKAAKASVTKAKDACAAAEKARIAAEKEAKKAAAEKAKAEKDAKMKAEKAAKAKAEKEAAEAKRKTDVATATGQIETASQQTGFLAAFAKWMKTWGQDTTTDVPVVADENTIARTIAPVAQSARQGMF